MADVDITVGVKWSQRGLEEIIAQAKTQIARLHAAAQTGPQGGARIMAGAEPATGAAVARYLKDIENALRRAGVAEKEIREVFNGLKGEIQRGATETRRMLRDQADQSKQAAARPLRPREQPRGPGGAVLLDPDKAFRQQEKIDKDRERIQDAIAVREANQAQREQNAAHLKRANQQAATNTAQQLRDDPDFITSRNAERTANAQRRAQEAQELAANNEYIQATQAAARFRELQSARIRIASAGEEYRGLSDEDALGRAAILRRTQAENARAAAARSATQADIDAIAKRKTEEAKLNAAIRERERAYIRDAIRTGDLTGTRFQKTMARFSTSAGLAPSDQPTLGQFVGRKMTTTVGFGAAGAVTSGLAFGLADLARDATELESSFVKLRGQLEAIGQGGQFEPVRGQIKDIAVDSGVAATDVTLMAQRLIGVYDGDLPRAMKDTAAAMRLQVVAGIDTKTMMESIIPVTSAFGASIEEIGDLAVAVADKYGVSADQFVQFAGKAAVVSEQSGLSLRELTIVAANMSKELGTSLETSAETFNKMPELVDRNRTAIAGILEEAERAGTLGPEIRRKFQESLAAGQPGQAALAVFEAGAVEGGLTDDQRVRLAQEIAVNREIEQGTALLKQSRNIHQQLISDLLTQSDVAGRMGRRYESLRDTVAQTFRRLARSLEDLAESLYSSGLSEFFATIGNGIGLTISGVTTLLGLFKAVNDATKFDLGPLQVPQGALLAITQFGLAAMAATKALQFLNNLRADGGKAVVAENADASARKNVASAATSAATAIKVQDAARQAGIGTATRSAAVETADATARRLGGTTATANQMFGQAARTGSAYLPPPPLGAGAANWRTRALSGGGQNWLTRRVAPNAVANATARQAAAAGAVGATALPLAGMAIGAGLVVKSAFDDTKAGIEAQAEELNERMRKASLEDLQKIANTETDFWSRVSVRFFGQELPEITAQYEALRKSSEGQTKNIAALGKTPGLAKEFASKISDQNLGVLEGFFEQSDVTQDLARELGLAVEDPSLANRVLSLNPVTGAAADRMSQAGGNVSLTRENLEKLIPQLEAKVKEGGERGAAAQTFLNDLNVVLEKQKEMDSLQAQVAEAVKVGDTQGAMDAAGGGAEYVETRLGTIKAEYDAGTISTARYLENIRIESERLRTELATPGGLNPEQVVKARDRLAKFDREGRKVLDEKILGRVEIAAALAELTGGDASATDLAERLRILPDLSAPGQLEQLPALIDASKDAFNKELASVTDPVERARRALQGFQIDPRIQGLLLRQQIDLNPQLQLGIENVAKRLGQTYDELAQQITDLAVRERISIMEAALQVLAEKRKELFAKLNPEGTAGADIDSTSPELKNLDAAALDLLRSTLGDAGVRAAINLSGYFNMSGDQMLTHIAEKSREWNVSIAEAVKKLLDLRMEEALRVARDPNSLGGADITLDERAVIDRLQQQKNEADRNFGGAGGAGATSVTTGKTDEEANLREGVIEAEAARARAQLRLRNSTRARDDIADAQATVDEAMLEVSIQQRKLAENANGDDTALMEAQANANEALRNLAEARRDRERALEDASFEWDVIAANGDPVQENAANMRRAVARLRRAVADGDELGQDAERQEIARLGQDAERNQQEILDSRLAVQAAIFERDPVRAAQIALQRAETAAANAVGEAARNEAEAARIQADHALEDAMEAVMQSRASLAIAMAEAAGDTVLAAQLAAEEAQRQLDEEIRRGAGEAEVNQLKGQVATANANVFRTSLNEQREALEFAHEMGQVTLEQLLAGYRAMLATTKVGSDEYKSLMRAINTLEQQARQDYQFNLPTTLGLPTLYEARRSNQSLMQGVGYQDNRQVAVVVNVNGAQDPAAITEQIVGAMSDALGTRAPAYAAGSRRYN